MQRTGVHASKLARPPAADPRGPLAEAHQLNITSIKKGERTHEVESNGPRNRARRAFVKRLDQFRLKVAAVPAEVKRSVAITAEPSLPGLGAKDLRLLWRFADGPWRGGERGGAMTIRFPTSGKYQIEIMGMDRLGGTSATSSVVVNATVLLPETRLAAAEPFRVKDVVWMAPVELIPSEPGAVPELALKQ